MRRVFLMTVAAGLVMGGTAAPALAASHTHHRSSSADVFAVWRSRAPLSHGRFQLTTWFVGVFQSDSRTSGQVIKQVVKCKRVNGRARCRSASFSAGFKRLTATEFTFDRKRLRSAHLDAAFRLRTFVRGKPVHISTAKVVADWTGVGRITRNGGIDTFRSGCLHFHDVFHGKNRAATATATVNKVALGNAAHAFLSTNTDISIEHRC